MTVRPEAGFSPDDSPLVRVGEPPAPRGGSPERFQEGELAAIQTSDEERIRLRELEAAARLKEAEADKARAETERIREETNLARVRGGQARDDRVLRVIAAGATFSLVVGWLVWLGTLIAANSTSDAKQRLTTPEGVQIALIVNAAVALIGLFAVILRGLFAVKSE